MFKGCSALIAGNATKSLLRFSVYNWATKFMADSTGESSAPQVIVAGMFTGLCESLLIVPFESKYVPSERWRKNNLTSKDIKITMIERSSLTSTSSTTVKGNNLHLPRHLAHQKAPQIIPEEITTAESAAPKKRVIRPKTSPIQPPHPSTYRNVLYEVTPGVHGLFGNVRDMYQVRGPRAFIQGFMPTIFRQVTNSTVRFTTFNFLKQFFHPHDSEPMPGLLAFAIGAVSGGVEVLATQPIDVVKTRMQTVNGIKLYGSSLLCSYKIFVEEGPTRLWAGMLPRFVKVTFSGGIVFGVYEFSNTLVMKAMQENPFSWE